MIYQVSPTMPTLFFLSSIKSLDLLCYLDGSINYMLYLRQSHYHQHKFFSFFFSSSVCPLDHQFHTPCECSLSRLEFYAHFRASKFSNHRHNSNNNKKEVKTFENCRSTRNLSHKKKRTDAQ